MAEDIFAAIVGAVREREAARCAALVEDDMDALAELMTDDLVHVHTTGVVHDKAKLLNHAGTFLQFLDVGRGDLTVRPVAPDVAVMTGPMTNRVRRRGVDEEVIVHAFVTQVWVRQGDAWRIASFHAVRLPDQA